MLGADYIGFHTDEYARLGQRFRNCETKPGIVRHTGDERTTPLQVDG